MNITVIFDNLGPYHLARLSALARLCDLTAIEVRERSQEYGWGPTADAAFRRVTLEAPTTNELCRQLDSVAPDVVFIPGWSSPAALAALGWCRRRGVPGVMMSDSQRIDFRRRWWQERGKGRIVRNAAGALVGGAPHEDYIRELGMTGDAIATGYDVVDNDYFIRGSDQARHNPSQVRNGTAVPGRYLLTSVRFISKKNLPRLLDAFARARAGGFDDWSLVILGDGGMRAEIEERRHALGLDDAVVMPGWCQYDALPGWFGQAEAFILASTSEQWGLVVNEAMASALPVLVSDRCGCAPDLVVEGQTGFTFPPEDIDAMTASIMRIMAMPVDERRRIGMAARHHIARFSPETFATAAMDLAQRVAAPPQKGRSLLAGWVFLPALARLAEYRGRRGGRL